MSLNEEAMDDLNSSLLDEDLIKTPEEASVSDKKTDILVFDKKVDQEPNVLSEAELDQIMQSNVQFKTIEDGIEHVETLKDVEKELEDKGSINKNFVKYAQEHFNSLAEGVSLEEFSVLHSKTNHNVVINKMKKEISIEEQTIESNFATSVTKLFEDTSVVLKNIDDSFYSDFRYNMLSLKEPAEVFIRKNIEGKDKLIIPKHENGTTSFLNLTTCELDKIELHIDGWPKSRIERANEIISNLLNIVNVELVRNYILQASHMHEIKVFNKDINYMEIEDHIVNLDKISKLFILSCFDRFIDEINDELNELLYDREEILGKIKELKDYKSIQDCLNLYSLSITNTFNKTEIISQIIFYFSQLGMNCKALFEIFEEE